MLAVVMILLFSFLVQLHYRPYYVSDQSGTYPADVLAQARYLSKVIHSGGAQRMQEIFPEGFLFMHALHALSWATIAESGRHDIFVHQDYVEGEAIRAITWSLRAMESPEGKRPFTKDMSPSYGVFYRGWTNYVRAKKIHLWSEPEDIINFQKSSDEIARALRESEGPFLPSYPHAAWPADMVVALASLARYDHHFGTQRYQNLLTDWVTSVRGQPDPATGLIPHAVSAPGNQLLEGARGCSQSLIHCFLPEIDGPFAEEQFQLYRSQFFTTRLGLPGIREYPVGHSGSGDVDSGPVIWEIGGAASIVGQRAMLLHGETEVYVGLRNAIEAFGLPLRLGKTKRYLAGVLPVADAFIAWSNATEQSAQEQLPRFNWGKSLQFFLLIILFLLGWTFVKL